MIRAARTLGKARNNCATCPASKKSSVRNNSCSRSSPRRRCGFGDLFSGPISFALSSTGGSPATIDGPGTTSRWFESIRGSKFGFGKSANGSFLPPDFVPSSKLPTSPCRLDSGTLRRAGREATSGQPGTARGSTTFFGGGDGWVENGATTCTGGAEGGVSRTCSFSRIKGSTDPRSSAGKPADGFGPDTDEGAFSSSLKKPSS